MIRAAELAILLVPLLAFGLWRLAIARGLPGPPPRQLALIFAALVAMGAALVWFEVRDSTRPGRYIPAQVENGQIVPGHVE